MSTDAGPLPCPRPPGYETPPGRASLLGRCLPTAVFYTRVVREVVRAQRACVAGTFDDANWIDRSRHILLAAERVGGRARVEGLDVVARLDGPAVFIGNHMSTLETFVLPCLIQPLRPVTFIVKESLVRYPIFGHVMRARDPVVVGRRNPRDDLKTVLDEGAARLGRGVSIIVFPQTTRTLQIDPEQFNSIGVKLAKKAGVPVVPFAVRTDLWGTGGLLRDFGSINPRLPMHFAFGEPLAIGGNGREAHEAVIAFVTEKLHAWLPDASAPAPL